MDRRHGTILWHKATVEKQYSTMEKCYSTTFRSATKEEQIQQRAVYHEGDLEDNMNDDEGRSPTMVTSNNAIGRFIVGVKA